MEDRALYDCNDNDPATNPGAEDMPNDGVDQDCDDEDCVDLDGDGSCAGLDCDDTRDDVYVGAPEVADCLDHDCDGVASDGTVAADDDGDGACEGVDLGAGAQCCELSEVPGDCDDDSAAGNLWDLDGDGLDTCGPDAIPSSGDEDCDDGDDDRLPGFAELCDGKDNDCDGALPADELDADTDGDALCDGDCDDTDAGLYNHDLDLDGYTPCEGDCDDTTSTLRPVDLDLDTFSTCAGDCADTDADRFPGAVELCDGIDSDCDGAVAPSELDGDGDGSIACLDCDDSDGTLDPSDTDGDGVSSCAGDCDDGAFAVNPGAADSVGDGLDQNCDALDGVDGDQDGDASLLSGGGDCDDADPFVQSIDLDGDGSSSCAGDCDDVDPLVEALDADTDGVSTCDGDCVDGDPAIYPHATEIPGDGVDDNCDGLDLCEDLNCDGWTDLVFTNNYNGSTYALNSSIYWGGPTGFLPGNKASFPTNGGGDVKIADLDGDGYLDLVVANQGAAGAGDVDSYVYWGSPAGYSAGDRTGLPTRTAAGASLGDLDGDGFIDLVFSNFWDGATVLIDSWIYWGSASGYSTADRSAVPTSGAWGNTIADVDNDGFPDIVFSNFRNQTVATVNSFVYWGSPAPYSSGDRTGLATEGAYGTAVADLNGDGWNEVIYAGFTDFSSYVQDAVIHWGDATGFSGATTLLPTEGGSGVNAADMDGDGDLDLVVSCERNGGNFAVNSRIYWNDGGVFSAGSVQQIQTFGAVVNLIADLDGDGTSELIFANWYDNTSYARDSFIYWGTSGTYSPADRTGLPTIGGAGVAAAGPGIPVLRTVP